MATKKIIEDAPLDDAVADDDYEGIDAEGADDDTYTVPADDGKDGSETVHFEDPADVLDDGVIEVDDGYIDGVPPPITPATPLLPAQERVLWENEVNDAARAFGLRAEREYIDARVAGNDIELTVVDADGLPVSNDDNIETVVYDDADGYDEVPVPKK